jgi:hypothetical protein
MAVKGRGARAKGHGFEREIANKLKVIDPLARRNVSESQEGGFDILTRLPIAIQCKCFSRWHSTPHEIFEQARKHAKGRLPVGVVRISRKNPDLVIMDWDDFFAILETTFKKPEELLLENKEEASQEKP